MQLAREIAFAGDNLSDSPDVEMNGGADENVPEMTPEMAPKNDFERMPEDEPNTGPVASSETGVEDSKQ